MKAYLNAIRTPQPPAPLRVRAAVSVGLALLGFLLGVGQKWLDALPSNELPLLLQRLDIQNYFGRLAVWILLAAVIAVFAGSPRRAAVNVFLFLACMVAGYYLYCRFALHFLPVRYMLVWVAAAAASPVPACLCWYAKGKGFVAVLLSAGILGVLLAQAFRLTQGFAVMHEAEVLTWALGLVVLRRRPKEFVFMLLLSVAIAFLYQLVIPVWG